jgi:hypothetical protein
MSGKGTCPQAVSRESYRTRNKNKQTNKVYSTQGLQTNKLHKFMTSKLQSDDTTPLYHGLGASS